MTALLTDIHKSEGLLEVQQTQLRESQAYGQEIMAAVFVKHGVTREQYDTSLVWYSQNLKKLIRIYGDVKTNLEADEQLWRNKAAETAQFAVSMQGDSVDLWTLPRTMLLDERRLTCNNVWTIPADSCFEKGDGIEWQFHIGGMPDNQCAVASLALLSKSKENNYSIEMIDGVSTNRLNRDTLLTLRCQAKADDEIYQVKAALYLLGVGHQRDSLLLPVMVDSIQMLRIHSR